MQQLFEGVFLLEGDVGGRPLQLLYLRGRWLDSVGHGLRQGPRALHRPADTRGRRRPCRLTWIINSHPDLDHTGGNYLMKQIAPQALLACGDADRVACSGPEELLRLRYDRYRSDHGLFYEGGVRQWVREQSGKPQPIASTFVGGEHIRLAPDWEVEIVALPGHARGHLGILDGAIRLSTAVTPSMERCTTASMACPRCRPPISGPMTTWPRSV